jgi:hypothetical protein
MMQRRVYSRAQAEAEFVHALTRQVGYTAGAYSVQRMAGIVAHFEDANAYQFELVKKLTAVGSSADPLTEKYATDVLNFAGELGIIAKLPGASAPHLSRYVLTDAGVAIRAARAVRPELEQLVLEHLILENDADAYLRVLHLLCGARAQSGADLSMEFRDTISDMRLTRLSWLQQAFPSRPLLLRLVKGGPSQVHWMRPNRLGVIELDKLSSDFGRHHFTPRKTWASELNHVDPASKGLTPLGQDFMSRAGWRSDNASEHWIAPANECMASLRISVGQHLYGASCPTLELMRPRAPLKEPDSGLVELTADFLRSVFPHIRLVHARQALTSPITYFLLDHERSVGERFDQQLLLQMVAKAYGKEFSFLSSRSGTLAYYQLRKSTNA